MVIQMAKGIPFLIKKRDIYYLQKRVPKKLIPTIGREFVRLSLRTRDKATAIRTAGPILAALERDWHYQLFAIPVGTNVIDHFGSNTISEPTLTEAAASYIEMKGKAEDRKFTNPTNLVINAIVQQSGNKVISAYVRSDAVRFRDGLIRRGVSQATVKRNLSIIRSIWNFAAREHGIMTANPFANMNYGNASGPVRRLPIPLSSIRQIHQQCINIDDDMRWLIAIISDSGMRLSEAAGLVISDIHLSATIPYVSVKEHAWRQLKTSSSTRDIPLIGMSLWGVKQAISSAKSQFLFPRYCNTQKCKADYASSTLNKWLRKHVPDGCVVHSFRHSMRDRLRAVQCPSDIIDQIGGWQTAGVGQSYGNGYTLEVLHEWMSKL